MDHAFEIRQAAAEMIKATASPLPATRLMAGALIRMHRDWGVARPLEAFAYLNSWAAGSCDPRSQFGTVCFGACLAGIGEALEWPPFFRLSAEWGGSVSRPIKGLCASDIEGPIARWRALAPEPPGLRPALGRVLWMVEQRWREACLTTFTLQAANSLKGEILEICCAKLMHSELDDALDLTSMLAAATPWAERSEMQLHTPAALANRETAGRL